MHEITVKCIRVKEITNWVKKKDKTTFSLISNDNYEEWRINDLEVPIGHIISNGLIVTENCSH